MNFFDINDEFDILAKYKLTPNELMAIRTILLAIDGDNEYLIKFNNILTVNDIKFRDILISLKSKGIILQSYDVPKPGEVFELAAILINKNFIKNFYRSAFYIGKELYDAYPQSTLVNGCIYTLKRISKKFNSLEDAFRVYGKIIKWNPETHYKIIELIKWGIDNNYNFTTLDNFIVDQAWNSIEAVKNGVAININFNAIKEL